MEKTNIAELLRDCPKGMELYSPLCGICVFDHINYGTIVCKKQNTQEITFTSEGYYMLPVFDNCECMIFPSKDQRDWSKFHRPFRDGDILFVKGVFSWVLIYKEGENKDDLYKYVAIPDHSNHTYIDYDNKPLCYKKDISKIRFATGEERRRLFDTLKECGYRWNDETKTLEKLPKFKVGDRVKHISAYASGIVVEVTDNGYHIEYPKAGGFCYIGFELEKDYELAPSKFDVTTLKPFDKVLVRPDNRHRWSTQFFERMNKKLRDSFICVGGQRYYQCIPYEGNEHLLDTATDCDNFYKNWD